MTLHKYSWRYLLWVQWKCKWYYRRAQLQEWWSRMRTK